ncbi:MAG: Unknown protein [uncultured Sulfurovum sp.]|uniref:Transposase IS4-like domain-containing protein n=1 Tax=uncultured Sulfurovum sp. TaxID=269237 RepID=A0A6S6SGP5_9BACT|nr:MAG: Unknown protein [uncultured Sulfurovum sp.]
MLPKHIANVLNNNFNALSKKCGLTGIQSKNLKLLGKEMLEKGILVLRKLTPESGIKTAKEQGKTFGNTLQSVDIENYVQGKILKEFCKTLKQDTVIGYDLTDEIHPYADIEKGNREQEGKGMENISKVFDGSRRRKETGYSLHGIGTSEHLLRLETHKAGSEFLPQKRKQILKEMLPALQGKGIWAFDRGNDDEKLFSFLNERSIQYIVRLKNKRQVLLLKTGEVFDTKDLPEGRHRVFIRTSGKSEFDTENEYLLIKSKHLEDKTPILLLCSINISSYSDAKLIEKYLKRWGVETQFRKVKQIYQLEKIQVRNWNRRKNLLALVVFMHFLSTQIENKVQAIKNKAEESALLLWQDIKEFLRKKSKEYNFYSFMEFLRTQIPKTLSFFLRDKTLNTQEETALTLF